MVRCYRIVTFRSSCCCCPAFMPAPPPPPSTSPTTTISKPLSRSLLPEPPTFTTMTTPNAGRADPTTSPTSADSPTSWGARGGRGGHNNQYTYRDDRYNHRYHRQVCIDSYPSPIRFAIRLPPLLLAMHRRTAQQVLTSVKSGRRRHQQLLSMDVRSTNNSPMEVAILSVYRWPFNRESCRLLICEKTLFGQPSGRLAVLRYRDPCRTITEILSVFDEFQRDGIEFNEIHTSTALHR